MILGQAQRIAELNNTRLASDIKGVPVVAFTSGKGGTGKTTVALNIAELLARKGKKTLLVDFDLNFANVHVMLNIFPEYTINDYFGKKLPIENVIYKYDDNLHFVFGESGAARSPKISKAQLNEFFYAVKTSGRYDLIILDTASGGAPETLEVIRFADFAVIVATPEPTAVMDAYAIIKLILSRGLQTENFVIVNKTPNKSEAETAFLNINSAVKHFLKSEVNFLGNIPESSEVKKSVFSQQLFVKTKVSGKTFSSFEKVADALYKTTGAFARAIDS